MQQVMSAFSTGVYLSLHGAQVGVALMIEVWSSLVFGKRCNLQTGKHVRYIIPAGFLICPDIGFCCLYWCDSGHVTELPYMSYMLLAKL
jgi:hypothetical protein